MGNKYLQTIGEIEDYVRDNLNGYRLKLREISNDDLIDVVFGNLGECLDYAGIKDPKEQMMSIISYAFHYAHGIENRATKQENEKFKYHTISILKKVEKIKSMLYSVDDLPYDKELHALHYLLNKIMLDPYSFIKPPTNIPESNIFTAQYVEEILVMLLSNNFRIGQRRCVRAIKRTLKELKEIIEK